MSRLPILLTIVVLLSGCNLAVERDVLAYNACVTRHPQDVVLCEGPRQAYEINPSGLEASSVAITLPARYGVEEGLAVPVPARRLAQTTGCTDCFK